MKIQRYVRPKSLDEAYSLARDEKGFLLGGGAWSRMNSRTIDLAVDLSSLDLQYIKTGENRVEIGAMTTARDIETSADLRKALGSFLSDAVSHIVGVQLRNIITVGGTVAGKYGFSDLLTCLLALDAKVGLYGDGEVPIEEFLGSRSNGAKLVEKLVIETGDVKGAYASVRKSHTDFAVLNAAAVRRGGSWRVAVGARPGSAQLSPEAAKQIGSGKTPSGDIAAKAGEAAASELSFGGDLRGSADYRKQICSVLVKRAIMEVAE
jgi:CO/xanthine dehydrogenase FAD-binding subunit